MSSGQDGTFVYHPLNSHTSMFSLYDNAIRARSAVLTHELSDDNRTRLLSRYRQHIHDVAERRGLVADAVLKSELAEDKRGMVRRFRAFFPSLIDKTALSDKAKHVAVFFPVLDCFDNRCVEIKGHDEAIF